MEKGKKRGQMGKISASKASRVMVEEVERSTVSPPQTTSRLASLVNFFVRPSRFFFLFPPMRSLVPGYVQVVLEAPPSCPNWAPQLLPNSLPILFWTPATQATQGTGLLLCDESIYRIIHYNRLVSNYKEFILGFLFWEFLFFFLPSASEPVWILILLN